MPAASTHYGHDAADSTAIVVSVVIPILDDAEPLRALLNDIAACRGAQLEVIVVDGGSRDDSVTTAETLADRVLTAPRGRASQLAAGIEAARGRVVWLLHADSRIGAEHVAAVRALASSARHRWGRFDVRLAADGAAYRVIEWMMSRRSCLTGICTGDQGIFASSDALQLAGGMPPVPLMEDIALSKRLRRFGRPLCCRERIETSARRWQRNGIWPTILLMWWLRLRYFLGGDPAVLAARYYRGS